MKLHPATDKLVDDFSQALKSKLAEAEAKYGWTNGWLETGWMDDCRAMLMEHVGKGDPRDVAAYCAFLWHHGELTCSRSDALGLKPLTPEDSDPSGYVLPRALREASEGETTARRTAEYWKAELNAANVEIERLRYALEQMVARTWGLDPATSSDGCYTDEPLERLARAALVDGP